MKSFFRFALTLCVVSSISLSGIQSAFACGPFTIDPVFGFTRHGEYPLTEYSGGRTGIVPTSYGRISLFVYYRHLNDLPFEADEKDEVARAIANRIGISEGENSTDTGAQDTTFSAVSVWINESKAIRPIHDGGKDIEDAIRDREREGRFYVSYLGCLDDAYLTAAKTLKKRIDSGYDKKDIANWVAAQDAVFSNCGEDGAMPASVPSDSPVWLQKDRDYQNAAALFYQQKHADARNAFALIASDESSLWSRISNYLIARTYIREASFIDTDETGSGQSSPALKQKNNLLASAAGKLNELINDPSMSDLHSASKNLLGLVRYRMDPSKRTIELAGRLSNGTPNPNIYNDLTDYIWLLDKIEQKAQNFGKKPGDPDYSDWYRDPDYILKLTDVPSDNRAEDLTDWLITYQSEDGFEHAVERWKSTKKIQWLVAAIVKANGNHSSSEALIADVSVLPPTSPAFATSMYHAIRLSHELGKDEQAANLTDRVFAAGFESVPAATRNSFFAQRLDSVKNLTEFLRYAKRTPTSYLWSDDHNEAGSQLTDTGGVAAWEGRQMFGEDSVAILNTLVPLDVWLRAAENEEVPDHLRDFIVSAGWMRAFFLKDAASEARFSRLMASYSKDYAPLMRSYYSARSGTEREAAALIAIGRYPVLEPSIADRWGRKTSSPTTIDSNRGNWWCFTPGAENMKRPAFLSDAANERGRAEYETLRGLGEGSTAFASRAVEFAKRAPRHRKTPEILHLAVRSTRYGCRDERTGSFSKEAFDLLHRRYRNSVWTRKTPFWFSGQ